MPTLSPDFSQALIRKDANIAEQISDVTAILQGPLGPQFREQMAEWARQIMPAATLVPEAYAQWRPLVQEAMRFILLRLSDARLAPKFVEQISLPPSTSAEVRLLKFIAKVPGLQKLGQVLARNRHLQSALRMELSKLENGISDMRAEDVLAILNEQLGRRLQSYEVEVEQSIASEATVSAVIKFTWRSPESCQPEAGVFKVMKPHVPAYFAEDMQLLQQLAGHLEKKHDEYGFASDVLAETFRDVRQLLEHELDFRREQATLLRAFEMYRPVADVRTPRLIEPLCTSEITAMSEESGVKVTDAVASMPEWRRRLVAGQVLHACIAVPLFAAHRDDQIFHADPHAGNLLYDERTEELVILDWALTEQLTYGERRHLALLFMMIALRDPAGVCNEIKALSECDGCGDEDWIIKSCVARFIRQLPFSRLPGAVDALELMDRIALKGVSFPTPLLMFRKVLFTLDGIVHEIAGMRAGIDLTLAPRILQHWMSNWATLSTPLQFSDLLALQSSALLYGNRIWTQWIGATVCGQPAMSKGTSEAE